jgi:hypothetical protein
MTSVVRTEWFRLVDECYLRDSGFRGGVLEFFFWISYVCTLSEI